MSSKYSSHPEYETRFILRQAPREFMKHFKYKLKSLPTLRRYINGVQVSGLSGEIVRLPSVMMPGRVRAFSMKDWEEFGVLLNDAYGRALSNKRKARA
jgi:hypothetical protein